MLIATENNTTFHYTYRPDDTICIHACATSEDKIKIPEEIDGHSVTEIAAHFLENFEGIKEVVFPDSVYIMGENVLNGCYDLNSVRIPNNIEYIPNGFCNLTDLRTVEIPDKVRVIGNDAFRSCFDLCEVTLGKNVETIGIDAFALCSLTSFHIGPTVKQILYLDKAKGFLSSNPRLQSITVDKNNPNFRDINGVLFSRDGKDLIRYPQDKKDKEYFIPKSVRKVLVDAFWGSKLEKIGFGRNLNNLDYYTFGNIMENIPSSKDITVYCCKESNAEKFAKERGCRVEYNESEINKFINGQINNEINRI